MKLKRSPREKEGRTRFDTQKLADEEIRTKYNIEVGRRFQVLENLKEDENADQTNNSMENIYVATAKEVLGIAKGTSKPWLRRRTRKKVEERRQNCSKLESTRSERVKQRIRKQYRGEFDFGPFRPAEVKDPIKSTKTGKAAALDNLVAERLKTDLEE